jgi:ribosomal protein S27E
MDIVFNCTFCQTQLEVGSEASGQEIACPVCGKTITIPTTAPAGTKPPSARVTPTADEKRLAVALSEKPTESLIQKPKKTLEAAAKDLKPAIRVKTIRHSDCKEVGHDKFDETVTEFLNKVGDQNITSITPINYSYIEMGTQKMITDFGVMIVYRG